MVFVRIVETVRRSGGRGFGVLVVCMGVHMSRREEWDLSFVVRGREAMRATMGSCGDIAV